MIPLKNRARAAPPGCEHDPLLAAADRPPSHGRAPSATAQAAPTPQALRPSGRAGCVRTPLSADHPLVPLDQPSGSRPRRVCFAPIAGRPQPSPHPPPAALQRNTDDTDDTTLCNRRVINRVIHKLSTGIERARSPVGPRARQSGTPVWGASYRTILHPFKRLPVDAVMGAPTGYTGHVAGYPGGVAVFATRYAARYHLHDYAPYLPAVGRAPVPIVGVIVKSRAVAARRIPRASPH